MTDEQKHPLDYPPAYHSNLPRETEEDRALRTARGLLQNLFVGSSLEVRTHGFALIRADLLAGLYNATETEDTDAPADMLRVRADARIYGLTAEFALKRFYVVFRKHHPSEQTTRLDFMRASGEVQCPVCKFEYREHPADDDAPFLKVLCDGKRVKL